MKILQIFLFSGFLFQSAYGQQKLPEEITVSIENRIQSGLIPSIVVGIIDKNGSRYFNFGTKTTEGSPVDEHTLYEIGSITKSFTGILLAQMALDGDLNIDDPAQMYLPESVKLPVRNGRQITLGHLSDHTSGIPRQPTNYTPKNFSNPYADFNEKHLYSFLNNYVLTRDIGSGFEYSNVGAGLLGHILSLKADTSYEELMKTRIATPLRMEATHITVPEKLKQSMALGHINGVHAPNWDFSILAGAGAIRSSLYDMLRFVGANMGVLKSELLPAMQLSHQVRYDKKTGGLANGLGWVISEGAEGEIIWHNGVTGGYRSFIGFVRDSGIGVVVLTNSDKSADDIGMRLLNSNAKLQQIKKPAIASIKKSIETKGVSDVWTTYENLKNKKSEYDFDQSAFDLLAHGYLEKGKLTEALAVLKINVDEFPNSSKAYDNYGAALMKDGQTEAAINNFKKSLELHPGNKTAKEILTKMGIKETTKVVTVPENVLESYVGVFQIVPGMNITITKDGKQLFGQVRGPEKFELFAKSNTEFYVEIAPVQITFSDNDGKVDSLRFYQDGNEKHARRIQ